METKLRTYGIETLEGAEARAYPYMGKRGELPMATGYAAQVVSSTAISLYDSVKELGEMQAAKGGGIFPSEFEAFEHGRGWLAAQFGRAEQVDALRAARRERLVDRWDEIDAVEESISDRMATLKAAKATCVEDRATLRSEARRPEVDVVWTGRAFSVVDVPSLSEGTCGRRWSGAGDEAGQATPVEQAEQARRSRKGKGL
jgi:hypothetical protein